MTIKPNTINVLVTLGFGLVMIGLWGFVAKVTGDDRNIVPLQHPDAVQTSPSQTSTRKTNQRPLSSRASFEILRLSEKEVAQISNTSLRDQAYLRLVDFCIETKLFGEVDRYIDRLSRPELRDTARSRFAVGLAKNGHVGRAFELIEEIELEDLVDTMRLQVIEAATDVK